MKSVTNFRVSKFHKTQEMFDQLSIKRPITVAARSMTWTIFSRSNIEIVGLNPAGGMDFCVILFCVCVVLCVGSGLTTGWSPVQGVLPTVCRIRKTEKEAKAQQEGCRA
jgi:hypothetical protein